MQLQFLCCHFFGSALFVIGSLLFFYLLFSLLKIVCLFCHCHQFSTRLYDDQATRIEKGLASVGLDSFTAPPSLFRGFYGACVTTDLSFVLCSHR